MPDLLVFTPDNELNRVIEQLGEAHGYRVRTCLNVTKASDWLEIRVFDALVLHASIPLEQQQLLAGMLWKRSLNALFFIFDFEDKRNRVPEMRLLGAEVFKGRDALAMLDAALRRRAALQPKESSDFRILVVEDLQSPRDIICIFIESLGYPLRHRRGFGDRGLESLEQRSQGVLLRRDRCPHAVYVRQRADRGPARRCTPQAYADLGADCIRHRRLSGRMPAGGSERFSGEAAEKGGYAA